MTWKLSVKVGGLEMEWLSKRSKKNSSPGVGFKFPLLLTLIVLSLSLMPGGAYAANYYIAPTGSDSNNGSSTSSPWATFAHAIGKLSAGDTLNLMDGTYSTIYGSNGDVIDIGTNGTSGNPITIQALNKGQAIIDCGNAACPICSNNNYNGVYSYGDYAIIKNLVVENCTTGIYFSGTGSNSIAFGNTIHDSETPIFINSDVNYTTLDSNTIYNFGVSGSNQAHGLYARGESTIIRNNLVYGNLGSGWSIQAGQDSSTPPTGDWQIVNNTLVGTANSANSCIFIYGNVDFTNLYILNNICSGATKGLVGVDVTWGTTWYADYNLLTSTSSICLSDGGSCSNVTSSNVNHNFYNTSAGFVNSGAGDYSLASGSTAIGAGTSTFAPDYDIRGTARPQDGGYSIGAYEYVGSSTQYTITASAGSGGGISPSGPVQVSQGGDQSFTITPTAGYQIASVTVDGASVGAMAAYTFSSVSANHTIAATFTATGNTTSPITTPDPFTFTSQIGDALNTTETSNTITISGINTSTPVSISGGTYSVNGGAYTSAAGTVNNGDTVTVRVNSSSSPGTMVKATLTIGGVSGIFSVTTSGPSGPSGSNPINPISYTDTVPGAPTGASATAGNAQATVSFTAPGSNGGSVITLYTVTSNPGNITATGASSPITVTGLTNGVSYTFTVTATNSVGAGPASSPSNMIYQSYQSAQIAAATSPANTVSTDGFTVTLVDASTAGTNITVNWGDGNLSGNAAESTGFAGTIFTHTYPSAGKYTIIHTAADGAASSIENIPVTVPTKFTISGIVYASDGTAPIPAAIVILKQNGITKQTATSGAGGAYSFSNVPFGTYTISAYAAGYTFTPTTLTVSANISAQVVEAQ